MPARQGIRLNNMQGLFPESGEMGKKHDLKTVRVSQLRSLDLPIQNDQLLAQQRILHDQIGTAASEIGKQSRDPPWRRRLDPVFDAFLKPGEEFSHQTVPSSRVKVVIPPLQSVYPSNPSG